MQGTSLSMESPRPSCTHNSKFRYDTKLLPTTITTTIYQSKVFLFTRGETESRDTYLAVLVPSPAENLPFVCRNSMTVLESTKEKLASTLVVQCFSNRQETSRKAKNIYSVCSILCTSNTYIITQLLHNYQPSTL